MRRALDALYDGCAALAGLAMVGLLAMVLLSVVGRQVGFHLPGTDAYAGYLMAAAGFLALAHTLKRGEHIRVTLLLSVLKGRWHKAMEVWALAAASALAGLSAFYGARLVWQSRLFNDISTSNDATPLWIPQLAMALGAAVMAVAFIDEAVLELSGRRQQASAEVEAAPLQEMIGRQQTGKATPIADNHCTSDGGSFKRHPRCCEDDIVVDQFALDLVIDAAKRRSERRQVDVPSGAGGADGVEFGPELLPDAVADDVDESGADTEELGDVLRTAVVVPDMAEVVRDQELEVALAYHLHALHVNDLGGVEGGPHEFPGGGFFFHGVCRILRHGC